MSNKQEIIKAIQKERMPEVEVNYLECRREDMKILAQEG